MLAVQQPEPVHGKRTPLGKLKVNTNTPAKEHERQLAAAAKAKAIEELESEGIPHNNLMYCNTDSDQGERAHPTHNLLLSAHVFLYSESEM